MIFHLSFTSVNGPKINRFWNHLRRSPFNHNRAGSVPKVSQIYAKSIPTLMKIAHVRNRRNLILTKYSLYGKHIGLTTGGPRHHIKSIITKTMRLLSTKSPQMIPSVQNCYQNGFPNGSQNDPKSTWFPTESQISQNAFKWLPNGTQNDSPETCIDRK